MSNTKNKTLAESIISIDPTAEWVYNRHCSYCGKFLYHDEKKCKKCKTPATAPILTPIPFTTSASAIEKIILWAQAMKMKTLLENIAQITARWIYSEISSGEHKENIIDATIAYLDILE